MAVAFIRGLQGNNPKYFKVIATLKHFAAYSGPEPIRHKFSAVVTSRDLFDTYLAAFKACVEQGHAYSVMGAYSALNDVPDCANKFLLPDILRRTWGFRGYVVSDCGAIGDIYVGHKYAVSMPAAAAAAVRAGCDLSCGRNGFSYLNQAYEEGLIPENAIDSAVTRLMLARFRLGMFDPHSAVPYDTTTIADNNTTEHMAIARKVADESIVLLKNAGHLLPLAKDFKSVAVIGAYASETKVLLGNYHGTPSNLVTILKGIENKLGKTAHIYFAEGYNPLDYEIPVPVTVGKRFIRPSAASEVHGMRAEYFDNTELSGKPVMMRIDTAVDFRWGVVAPAKGTKAGEFSVRWSGTVKPPPTGIHELGVLTNQKRELYFDGKMLVNDWKRSGYNLLKYRAVRMEKGRNYKIRIDYSHDGTSEPVRFWWYKLKDEPSARSLLKKAVIAARKADVVVAVAGISPLLESEENRHVNLPGFKGGDRTRLRLPAGEINVLKGLYKTGKPMVLVLVGGSALAVDWSQRHILVKREGTQSRTSYKVNRSIRSVTD